MTCLVCADVVHNSILGSYPGPVACNLDICLGNGRWLGGINTGFDQSCASGKRDNGIRLHVGGKRMAAAPLIALRNQRFQVVFPNVRVVVTLRMRAEQDHVLQVVRGECESGFYARHSGCIKDHGHELPPLFIDFLPVALIIEKF